MLGAARARTSRLKLIRREIIFEVCQLRCSQYLNVTDRRTDRQFGGITALCVASRGKNQSRFRGYVTYAATEYRLTNERDNLGHRT